MCFIKEKVKNTKIKIQPRCESFLKVYSRVRQFVINHIKFCKSKIVCLQSTDNYIVSLEAEIVK